MAGSGLTEEWLAEYQLRMAARKAGRILPALDQSGGDQNFLPKKEG
jgi:hypothetical protein